MIEWIQSLPHLEQVFLLFAVIGTILFLVQLVLILVGGGDTDADVGGDAGGDIGHAGSVGGADASHGAPHHDGQSSDTSFKLLSYQGLTAFFMMFGLVGLAMSRGSGQGKLLSVAVAVAAGFISMLGVAKLFRFFIGLQSSGTLNLQNAVGQNARVYLRIKPDSPGQIEVTIQGRPRIYDAVSADKEEIPTDTRVTVTGVDGSIMIVKRIDLSHKE